MDRNCTNHAMLDEYLLRTCFKPKNYYSLNLLASSLSAVHSDFHLIAPPNAFPPTAADFLLTYKFL